MERRLHSQAVGENKTPDALLLFLRVRSVIWRYGSPSRTKSQGQISWLCGDNSWDEQTRKSLHFIKDPAGEQQSLSSSPPTLSITPLLPPVCHDIRNTRLSLTSVGFASSAENRKRQCPLLCVVMNECLFFFSLSLLVITLYRSSTQHMALMSYDG